MQRAKQTWVVRRHTRSCRWEIRLFMVILTCVPILAPFPNSYVNLWKILTCSGFCFHICEVAILPKTFVRTRWEIYKKECSQWRAQSRCLMHVDPPSSFRTCHCEGGEWTLWKVHLSLPAVRGLVAHLVWTVPMRPGSWVRNLYEPDSISLSVFWNGLYLVVMR